jgi:hypothetical protein
MRISLSSWLIIVFLLLGCVNPFGIRDPEIPIDPQSGWVPPLTPEQLLTNFQDAISGRNLDHYMRCLTDPTYSDRLYRFDPDPEVAVVYPDVFAVWDRNMEGYVAQQAFSLVPADSTLLLTFIEDVDTFIASDSAVFVKRYRLKLPHEQSGLNTVFEGQVEWRLSPDQRGEWTIYRWIDNGLSGLDSWSLLKAALGG